MEENDKMTKNEVIEALQALSVKDINEIDWDEVTSLKQRYYALRREETTVINDEEKVDGEEVEIEVEIDETEPQFISLVNELKDKRAEWVAQKEEKMRDNLKRKQEIIGQIESLANDTDNVNRSFNQFKDLQQEFKNLGEVPQENQTETWKKFQDAVEHYYDQLKINQELRDYDFKKNLEIKQSLVEKAEALAKQFIKPIAEKVESAAEEGSEIVEELSEEVKSDIIGAFKQLQDLHDQWKITGPVAKELRDTLWEKFREATVVINKEYQSFFEERKANEKVNEDAKIALCEKVEAIDPSTFKGANDWEKATKIVIEAQKEWKSTGFAARKVNNALYARFRGVCDEFFQKKSEFFQDLKASQAANLEKKIQLTEKAESLQDSTDWNKTAAELTRLQKEWKEVGPINRKLSEVYWTRFHTACDTFFKRRKESQSNTRQEEKNNLQQKNEVIAALKEIAAGEKNEDTIVKIGELQKKWRSIGFVPFKEKDKINDAYGEIMSELRKKFDLSGSQASMEKFESSIEDMGDDNNKLQRERDRLFRALEGKRSDLQTYENNLGFFTSKSKNGDGLVRDVKRKIELIKGDILELEKKISIIDQRLG